METLSIRPLCCKREMREYVSRPREGKLVEMDSPSASFRKDKSIPERSGQEPPNPDLATDPARSAELFRQSVAIMARLRAPDGCPWDREQSFDSIRKYTLEEAYEVFDAGQSHEHHLSPRISAR